MRVSCLALVVVLVGCGVSHQHRRTLLIDDLDPYMPRGQVTSRILGSGWCMFDSDAVRDLYRRCPADADLWLGLSYKDGHLVTATLLVPMASLPRGRFIRASGGPGRVPVEADPFHGEPERVVVMDSAMTSDLPASQASSRHDVLEALADEWRARFGAPFRHGSSWYEWRPRAGVQAFVALVQAGVVEIYRFDPSAISGGALVATRR